MCTAFSGVPGNRIKIGIKNLNKASTSPVLRVTSEMMNLEYEKEIQVKGATSVDDIHYADVPVPIDVSVGEYKVKIELLCDDGTTETKEIDITVRSGLSVYIGIFVAVIIILTVIFIVYRKKQKKK